MTHFFKDMSRDAAIATLQNGTLRWSTPPTLNDPFDMQFAFQLRVDKDAARRLSLEKCWNNIHGKPEVRPLNDWGRAIQENRDALARLSHEEFYEEIGLAIDETFDAIKEKMVEFNATIAGHFKSDKILCLSELPNSTLMWAYYAQNHSGVVLRFTDATPDNPLYESPAGSLC
jgi:hypothetical protein